MDIGSTSMHMPLSTAVLAKGEHFIRSRRSCIYIFHCPPLIQLCVRMLWGFLVLMGRVCLLPVVDCTTSTRWLFFPSFLIPATSLFLHSYIVLSFPYCIFNYQTLNRNKWYCLCTGMILSTHLLNWNAYHIQNIQYINAWMCTSNDIPFCRIRRKNKMDFHVDMQKKKNYENPLFNNAMNREFIKLNKLNANVSSINQMNENEISRLKTQKSLCCEIETRSKNYCMMISSPAATFNSTRRSIHATLAATGMIHPDLQPRPGCSFTAKVSRQ